MSKIGECGSRSEVRSIFDFLYNEKIRLMKKGPQALIGVAATLFYYIYLPTLLFPLYSLISSIDVIVQIAIFQPILGLFNLLIFNLIMNHIYVSKYPYFEKYRILDQKWP